MTEMDLNGLLNGYGPEWQQRVQDFCERVQAHRQGIYEQVLANLPEYRLREQSRSEMRQTWSPHEDLARSGWTYYGVQTSRNSFGYVRVHNGKYVAEYGGTDVRITRGSEQEAVADVFTEYLISKGT